MTHVLPELPYDHGDLAPFLSAETLEYHHGKHHRGYVEKLNGLVDGTELADLSLTELVRRADGKVFNNAAQHYNHSFYWRVVDPKERGEPSGDLKRAIERDFGSMAKLREAFVEAAKGHFGSGWCWLVADGEGRLHVRTTSDAGCPVASGETPLLTCDVWEHAYYIDYRNDRGAYLDSFWKAVNWSFAARCLSSPDGIEDEILGLSTSRR